MTAPSSAEFLVAFTVAAATGTVVFFHADRNQIRYPSAWASAVFLFLGFALPLYVLNVRRERRKRNS